MATFGPRGIKGPVFGEDDDTDPLDVAEHLLTLNPDQAMGSAWNNDNAHRWAQSLVLLDIARSLRKIASAGALNSPYRSKYSSSGF